MNASHNFPDNESVSPCQDTRTDLPLRVLVVDDDDNIRQINRLMLVDSGYEVDTAEDGAVAWESLQRKPYNLLITDNSMPKVSGVELLKQLRAARMTLPVILATGTSPGTEFICDPGLQPATLLLKPYTLAEFLSTVKKILHDPMKHSEYTPSDHSLPDPSAPDEANPPPRILVVDDDNDVRQLSVDLLAGSGYEVDAAIDGAAGWEALQTCDYDLVITDNKMPRMTGVEMIEKLRAARMSLPVIMATGNLPTHEFGRRPWLKPDITLERPFFHEELLAAVEKILGTPGDNRAPTPLPKPF